MSFDDLSVLTGIFHAMSFYILLLLMIFRIQFIGKENLIYYHSYTFGTLRKMKETEKKIGHAYAGKHDAKHKI